MNSDEGDGETIGEILLKKRTSTSIRFDLLASSSIAGLIFATRPDGLVGTILSVCAVTLVLTGAIRWLGVNGRFANEDQVLNLTYRPLELLTIIGIFHLVNTVAIHPVLQIVPLGQPVLTSIGAGVVTLAGIVAIEFIQWNYRLWWGTVFFVKSSASKQQEEAADEPMKALHNAFANLWAMIAYFLLKDAIPDGDEPELNELREFVDNIDRRQNGGEISSGIRRLWIVLAIIMVPTFALIAWILSWVLGPVVDVFVVLIGVYALQHVISFYYMTNGTLTMGTWLQTNVKSVLTYFVYTGIVYWLFFLL